MQVTAIFLEGRRMNLFDDEKIIITSKVTDINQIGKVFTDFTQSFTIPADEVNNAIFQHFYDVDVFGTFNSNIRVDCYIEVDTIPFKFGKLQLESITLKNKRPDSYKVTFYGSVKQLDDKFRDDELSSLPLDDFNHTYNIGNVLSGVSSSLNNNSVIYPLIGRSVWQYGTNNIYDISVNSGAIDYKELKPGFRVYELIKAIETKYGITFNSNFFERAPFKNMFLWCSKGKDAMKGRSGAQTLDITGSGNLGDIGITVDTLFNLVKVTIPPASTPSGNGFGDYTYYGDWFIYPQAGYTTVPYTVTIYVNGVATIVKEVEAGGVANVPFPLVKPPHNGVTANYNIQATLQSAAAFSYTSTVFMTKSTKILGGVNLQTKSTSTPLQNLTSTIYIADQLPKMKVKDFITGLFKLHNLVIKPLTNNSFMVEPYDDYMAMGDTFDVTPYVDIEDITVSRPQIYSEVIFKHQKANSILNARFRKNNDSSDTYGYGDLRATYDIDYKAELKIESPFELMMFERLDVKSPHASAGDLTKIHIGSAIEDVVNPDESPVETKPLLFYHCGSIEYETFPFKITDGTVYYDITNSNFVHNYDDYITPTTALVWGNSINTWDYSDSNLSLYNSYWSDYINDIYDRRQRKFEYSAVLPPSIINKLSINDKLIINQHRYTIQDYTLDLTTGEVKFRLALDIFTFNYFEGLSTYEVELTPGVQIYSFKITTKEDWTVSKVAVTGGTTDWLNINSAVSGTGDSWVTFTVDAQASNTDYRRMQVVVNINGVDNICAINQRGYIL